MQPPLLEALEVQEADLTASEMAAQSSGTFSAYPELPANERHVALFETSGRCSAQAEPLHF